MFVVRFLIVLMCVLGTRTALASSLIDIYREALATDYRLHIAKADLAVHQARRDSSLANLLPQVNASIEGTRNRRHSGSRTDYYSGERYLLSVSQPIVNVASWHALSASDSQVEEYSSNVAYAESNTALDTAERFLNILLVEEELAAVIEERKLLQQRLKQLQSYYEKQLAPVTDVLDVQARLSELQAREIEAIGQISVARQALSALVGRDVNEAFTPLESQKAIHFPVGEVDNWISRGLENSHELKALEQSVTTADHSIKQARSGYLPTLNFQVSAQKSDIGFDNASVNATETYVAALVLDIPLYSGGSTGAAVRESLARYDQADQQLALKKRELTQDIQSAYVSVQYGLKAIAANKRAEKSAESFYAARQKSVRLGVANTLDVIEASQRLFEARQQTRQSRYSLFYNFLRLHHAAGELDEQTLLSLNEMFFAETQV